MSLMPVRSVSASLGCDTIVVSTAEVASGRDTINMENEQPRVESRHEMIEEKDAGLLNWLEVRFRDIRRLEAEIHEGRERENTQRKSLECLREKEAEWQKRVRSLEANLQQAGEREQIANTQRESLELRLQEKEERVHSLEANLEQTGEREQIANTQRESLELRLKEKEERVRRLEADLREVKKGMKIANNLCHSAIRDNRMIREKFLLPLESLGAEVRRLNAKQPPVNTPRKRRCTEMADGDEPPVRECDDTNLSRRADTQMQESVSVSPGVPLEQSQPHVSQSTTQPGTPALSADVPETLTPSNNPVEDCHDPSCTDDDPPFDPNFQCYQAGVDFPFDGYDQGLVDLGCYILQQ